MFNIVDLVDLADSLTSLHLLRSLFCQISTLHLWRLSIFVVQTLTGAHDRVTRLDVEEEMGKSKQQQAQAM